MFDDPIRVRSAWREASDGGSTREEGEAGRGGAEGDGEERTGLMGKARKKTMMLVGERGRRATINSLVEDFFYGGHF